MGGLVNRLYHTISIHALRVEGDQKLFFARALIFISIHALRVEGDLHLLTDSSGQYKFLSTPSGWRATNGQCYRRAHALDFYPRPPGGGRPR